MVVVISGGAGREWSSFIIPSLQGARNPTPGFSLLFLHHVTLLKLLKPHRAWGIGVRIRELKAVKYSET